MAILSGGSTEVPDHVSARVHLTPLTAVVTTSKSDRSLPRSDSTWEFRKETKWRQVWVTSGERRVSLFLYGSFSGTGEQEKTKEVTPPDSFG